jgi:hypothetical protein
MSEVVEDSLTAVMKRAKEKCGYEDLVEVEDEGRRIVLDAEFFGAHSKAVVVREILKKWGFGANIHENYGEDGEIVYTVEITEDRRGTFDINEDKET